MKFIHFALLLVVGWGCSQGSAVESTNGAGVPAGVRGPVLSAAGGGDPLPTKRPPAIECMPNELVFGDTLLIRISYPRGPYLAVESPNGSSYFLAYPVHGDTTSPPAWIPEDRFARVSEVRLPTAEVRVSPWESALVRPERVFSRSGVYRIVVSENLETDMEDVPQASCEIRFRGRL